MDKREFSERLELVSRAGAVLFVAIYVAGFLVVSFHNASYGIVEFGFFRARLLSAGIIFAIFLGLPFLEASRIFGLFGLQIWKPRTLERHENLESSALVMQMVLYFSASWGIAFFMRFFLGDFDFSRPFILLYLGYPVTAAAVFIAMGRGGLRNPTVQSVLTLGLILIFLVVLFSIRQWTVLWLVAWFALVGWLTYQMDSPIREPRKLVQVEWHLVVLNIIGVFGLFAGVFYPKIRPEFGGGRPSRVLLQFANISPINNLSKTELWLLDETDSGYYVIQTPEDHKAIFVPKSLVSAVYFQAGKSSQ